MSAPTEAEATIAVEAAARKAWNLQRAELRDRGFPSPEFDHLDPMQQHRIREQVLLLVWAALEVLPRPSEIREQVADEIDAYAASETERTQWDGAPGLLGNWIGGIREGAKLARGELPPDVWPRQPADDPPAANEVPPGRCWQPAPGKPVGHPPSPWIPRCDLLAGHAGAHGCNSGPFGSGSWIWTDGE